MATRQEVLIKKIQELQKLNGWTDGKLCKNLGVNQSFWSRVKNAHLDFPKSLLEALSRELPGLHGAVMEYMASPTERATVPSTRVGTSPAKPVVLAPSVAEKNSVEPKERR